MQRAHHMSCLYFIAARLFNQYYFLLAANMHASQSQCVQITNHCVGYCATALLAGINKRQSTVRERREVVCCLVLQICIPYAAWGKSIIVIVKNNIIIVSIWHLTQTPQTQKQYIILLIDELDSFCQQISVAIYFGAIF